MRRPQRNALALAVISAAEWPDVSGPSRGVLRPRGAPDIKMGRVKSHSRGRQQPEGLRRLITGAEQVRGLL